MLFILKNELFTMCVLYAQCNYLNGYWSRWLNFVYDLYKQTYVAYILSTYNEFSNI